MKSKEMLIFIRNRWEIARQEAHYGSDRTSWVRRDGSWICDVGAEEAQMPMPAKPAKVTA